MAKPKKSRSSRKKPPAAKVEEVVEPVLVVEPVPEPVPVVEPVPEPEDLGPHPYLKGMKWEKADFWEDLAVRFEKAMRSDQGKYVDSVDPDDLHRAVVLFFWRQSLITRPQAIASHLAKMFARDKRDLPL